MQKTEYSKSQGIPHGSMDEDFLTHKGLSEWWYCTGYMKDEKGHLFTYQFSLANVLSSDITCQLLVTALTDLDNNKHFFFKDLSLDGEGVVTTADMTAFRDIATMTYEPNKFGGKGHMTLSQKGDNYSLSLDMQSSKPPVWHCEDGILKMGLIDDPIQKTYYFSYTNLDTSGKLILDGKEYHVTGKTWWDKQGGTYTIDHPKVQWEWFSLRFFDEEEIMLFAFPQDNYYDGTKIEKDGKYSRLNKYTLTPLGFTEANGYKFSKGWKIHMPGIKEEDYTLTPVIDGMLNFIFFEQLAEIRNNEGKLVGYAVVELLPGAYNEKVDSSSFFF